LRSRTGGTRSLKLEPIPCLSNIKIRGVWRQSKEAEGLTGHSKRVRKKEESEGTKLRVQKLSGIALFLAGYFVNTRKK